MLLITINGLIASSLISLLIMHGRTITNLFTSISRNNIGAKVFYSALGFDILGFEKMQLKSEIPISMNIGFFMI